MIGFAFAKCKERQAVGYASVQEAFDGRAVAAVTNFADNYNIFTIANHSSAVLKFICIYTIPSISCPALKAALTWRCFHIGINYFKIIS